MSKHVFLHIKLYFSENYVKKIIKMTKNVKMTPTYTHLGTFVYVTYIFIYKENDAFILSTPQ